MVCYHPYNQERAINLSILNMSGINTTSVEALAVGRDMVAHGISINQNHGSFRDPPLAVRWDGPLSRVDIRLATGLASWCEAFPVPAGVAPP